MADVAATVTADVANARQRVGVFPPRLSCRDELADDIVVRNCRAVVVVVRNDRAGRQREIVADARMSHREIIRSQTAAVGQRVRVRHLPVADDLAVVMVLLQHHHDVLNLTGRSRSGRGSGR
jgi:hypothetical protein